MGFIAMILGLLSQAKEHRKLRKQDALRRKYKREQQQMDEDYKAMRAEMSVEERAEADEQNEKDKKERKAAFDRRLKKEGNPNPVQGFFTTILGGIVSAINAIQITTIVIQIVAIILVLAIIVSIIASVVSMLANLFIDTTITEASTLGFQNRFDQIKLSQTVSDTDGAYRMLIQKVDTGSNTGGISVVNGGITDEQTLTYYYQGNENNDTNNYVYTDDTIVMKKLITDDVDLWTNINDNQLLTIVNNAIPQMDITENNKTYMLNVFRMIKMAYTICYAKDKDGNRYIKGLEPYTLLGIPFMEKGYGWLNAYTMQNHIDYGTNKPEETGWLYYADGTWLQNNTNLGNTDKTNVNNCISTVFLPEYNTDGAWCDGPYSWSILQPFKEDGDTMLNMLIEHCDTGKDYYELYMQLVSKDDYSVFKTMFDPSQGIYDDPNNYLVAMAFPSMLLTAITFDSEYYNGSYGSDNLNRKATLFGSRYLDNTDAIVYKQMDSEAESGDTIGYILSKALSKANSAEVSNKERLVWTKQLANTLYYSYHHAANFASVMYPTAFQDSENGIRIRDFTVDGQTVTEDDWYFGQLLLHSMVLSLAEGNIANLSSPEIISSYGQGKTYWLPMSSKVSYFDSSYARFGIGGEWFNSSWKSQDSKGLNGLKVLISAETFDNKAYRSHFMKVGNTRLDTSVWNYVLQYHGGNLARNIDPALLDKAFEPLAFSASSGTYFNMHAFHIEGLIACSIGSDLIEQCTNGLLEVEANMGGGGGSEPEPEDDTEYTVMFETNGGTEIPSQKVKSGKTVIRPTNPTKEGFYFAGWYSDVGLTTTYSFLTKITGNRTIYAKWSETEVTIDEPKLPDNDKIPYGSYDYIILPGEFIGNDGGVANMMMPVVDYSRSTTGIQGSSSGIKMYVSEGYGKYQSGGSHRGIDFSPNNSKIPAYMNDYVYSYINNTSYNDVKTDTYKAFMTYIQDAMGADFKTQYYNNRIPIVSMGDGIVRKVNIGVFANTYQDWVNGAADISSTGNAAFIIVTAVKHQANGTVTKESITTEYLHLCPDVMFIWDKYWGILNETNWNSAATGSKKKSVTVTVEKTIAAGQLIGYLGGTGPVGSWRGADYGAHMHLGDGTYGTPSMAQSFFEYGLGSLSELKDTYGGAFTSNWIAANCSESDLDALVEGSYVSRKAVTNL